MTDNQKEWLITMFENEIKEAKGTIANERIWEKGCSDEYNPHTENIREYEDYIRILNEYVDEIKGDN